MVEGRRVFTDATQNSQSGCKNLEGKSDEVLLPHYPYSEDTVYEYGANGAPYNRTGKIVRIQDETGTIEYKYGKLGETTEEKRTIKHVNAFVHKESTTAVMSYVSDYLGRMQKIVYPDTEVIRYGYDAGGQVTSITGTYAGLVTEYVRDIGYDEYGQLVFIEYGNDVKTEYSYNKERRWLANIRTQRRSETYQNIEYSFDKVGNVLGYKNDTTYYSTEQNYTYDSLYQLTGAQGKSINKPYGYVDYTSNYQQTFSFDTLGMGNMTSKVSSVYNNPDRLLGENINYSLEYEYDENYAHRVKRIGNRYYSYDENGNVILEQDEPITAQEEQRYEIQELGENLYGVEYGWALENEEEQNKVGSSGIYKRRYRWNERNLMQESSENRQSVYYRYGADGQRALKSSNQSETLYFNTMWSRLHNSSAYNTERESKHIYLGSERLVTRTNGAGTQGNTYTAQVNTYYYHSDHLGSAQLITDNEGKEYERIEYTPYGEYWIEKRAPENKTLPFKFTGKERDEETGLYYYGARYLDPKTSRWLSADPALSDYIPLAPVDDNARKHNQNLPGMGGIYNTVNFHLYHYAGNNPIKYTDPTGKFDWDTNTIESGDTLSKITDEYNTRNGTNYTYDDMAKANGIEDPNKIYAGDKLDFDGLIIRNNNQNDIENIQQEPIDNTIEDIGYSKSTNIMVGLGELTLGVGLWYASYKAGQAIVITGGASSVYAGKAAIATFASGSFFVAHGIGRITGVHNKKIEDEIVSGFEPLIKSVVDSRERKD